MFGAGWTEMLIIGIVALVVIGPKDLPVVMRKIGRIVGTVRRMGTEFQQELNKTTGLDQIADLRRSITEPLRQTSEEIAREFNRQTSTGIEPSGVMKPLDPEVESVYEQITANAGVPATEVATPAVTTDPVAPSGEPLPVPAEAAVVSSPVEAVPTTAKAARPRARKAAVVDTPPAEKPAARKRPGKAAASEAAPIVTAETAGEPVAVAEAAAVRRSRSPVRKATSEIPSVDSPAIAKPAARTRAKKA